METYQTIASFKDNRTHIRVIRYAIKSVMPEAYPPKYWIEIKDNLGADWTRMDQFKNRKTALDGFKATCLDYLLTNKPKPN